MNTETEQPLAEAPALIADLALALGVTNIKDLPGAWVHKMDEHWIVAANGKKETVKVEQDGIMGCDLKPFHMAAFYNGWLAALMTPFGGTFMAGACNEDRFIEAIKKAIERAEGKAITE